MADPKRDMTGTGAESSSPDTAEHERHRRLANLARRANFARRASGAAGITRAGVTTLLGRLPRTLSATRASASSTTDALQTLADPTLRWLAAGSVGLGAGLYLAGAPRLFSAIGMAPAVLIAAAIVTRPSESVVETPQELT